MSRRKLLVLAMGCFGKSAVHSFGGRFTRMAGAIRYGALRPILTIGYPNRAENNMSRSEENFVVNIFKRVAVCR